VKAAGKDVEYTRPMHPQVRQTGPGNCPICGMRLEPVLATAETGDSPELRDMTRRFWIGLALTVPVFGLEMGGHLFDIHHLIGQQTSNWIQLLFGTPVVLWAGWLFFVRAVASVRNRSLNMFTLIALGTGAAWVYSIAGAVASNLFPAALRTEGGAVPVYFEAAAVITVLSQATMRNIRQNLFLSFAYNVAGIPLAAGVLDPFFGLLLSPAVAAAAMALSSVSVIANALRLRTVKIAKTP
jgi:cation transport ATPase